METITKEHKKAIPFLDLPDAIQNMLRDIQQLRFIDKLVYNYSTDNKSFNFIFKTSKYLVEDYDKINALVPPGYVPEKIHSFKLLNELTLKLIKC